MGVFAPDPRELRDIFFVHGYGVTAEDVLRIRVQKGDLLAQFVRRRPVIIAVEHRDVLSTTGSQYLVNVGTDA